MKTGKIFLGVIFLLVAAYIIFYVPGSAAKILGGGVLVLLGIITLIPGFKKCKDKPAEEPEAEAEKKEE